MFGNIPALCDNPINFIILASNIKEAFYILAGNASDYFFYYLSYFIFQYII
jgi:hypothetical protein